MSDRVGIMLAKTWTEPYFKKLPQNIIVQHKIDGDRLRAVPYEHGYRLYSSQGNERKYLTHINKALDKLFNLSGLSPLELDGEAYIHGWKLQDIRSITSRTVNPHEYSWMMEYHIFDTIQRDKYQWERIHNLSTLSQHFGGNASPLKLVKTETIDKDSYKDYLEEYIRDGYEGIIIRNPDSLYLDGKKSNILKLKPNKFKEFKILEGFEAISKMGLKKGMLGGLKLWDEEFEKEFKCGAGVLTHINRKAWWIERMSLFGMTAKVKYLTLTKDNIPREPILLSIKETK